MLSCTLFKSFLAAPPPHPSRAQILPQESGLCFLLFISLGSDRATAGWGLLSPAPSASDLTTLTPPCPSGPRLAEEGSAPGSPPHPLTPLRACGSPWGLDSCRCHPHPPKLASCHGHPPPGAGAGHWLTCPNQSCLGPALLISPLRSLRCATEVCDTPLTWIPTLGRKSQGSRFQAGIANEKAPMSDLPFKIDGISFHIPLLMMLLSPTLCGLRGQVPWEL